MKKTKIICGDSCQVEVIAGMYLRFWVMGSYYESPNKAELNKHGYICKLTKANMFIVGNADFTLMVEECEDGSCCIWGESLVDFDITDEQAEELQEEKLNLFESMFPELKNKLSSSSWWLGSSDISKDFLLTNFELQKMIPYTANFRYTGTDAELNTRNGQMVQILGGHQSTIPVTEPEYDVRFTDGLETHVCGSALSLTSENPADEVLSVSGLGNVLSILHTNQDALSKDGWQFVAALERIYLQESESPSIELADLAAFDANILWNKNADVSYVLESGVYDEDMHRLGLCCENTSGICYDKEFLKDVACNIDWDDVASAGISAGNDIIDDVISGVLETYRAESTDIVITRDEYDMVQKYIHNEAHLGEDETISFTAAFSNGIEMDIKVCGTHDENECAWTEAVLFDNGNEIGCTEVYDEFALNWRMREGKTMFEVNFIIKENTTKE